MLIERYGLNEDELKHFRLRSDPFREVSSAEDVFLWGDVRRVREQLYAAAKTGDFFAVVGESGSGKTTMVMDFEERVARDGNVVLIKPHTEEMESSDKKGTMLRAKHLAEAILRAAAPGQRMRQSPDARMDQVETALREGSRANKRYVLLIEEAHSMPVPTLRHLKRFRELREGFRRFLGVVLVGQPELRHLIDPNNSAVREVVQRISVVSLPQLRQDDLVGYLRHRFGLVGAELGQVVEEAAVAEVFRRLADARLCYPLAANNLLARAMGAAARVRAPVVSAAAVRGV